MKEIKISPFYCLAIFYLVVNFVYAMVGYKTGVMEIEFQRKVIDSISFIYAFAFQFLSMSLIILVYLLNSKKLKSYDDFVLSNKVGWFLFFGQLFYFLLNMYFGANIAGDTSSYKGNAFINIFFILLPFDILFFILGICLKSSRLFFLNSVLYLISNLVRGWMGVPLLLLFAILCRQEYIKLKVKNIIIMFFGLLSILLSSPYLMELKWLVRGKLEDVSIIDNVSSYGYLNYLSESIDYIFNRFQHVGHVALILDNREYLNLKYSNDFFVNFWAEGLPQTIFMNFFSIDSFTTFSRFVTVHLFNVSPSQSWTVNVGMAGWFLILDYNVFFYLLYLFLILFFPFYFVAKYANRKLFLVLSIFSIFYLFHGWFYAYFTLVMYMIIIIFLSKVKL
ncbi:oligosaccharide repeat unit polymerase [Acinetobacter sp. AS167]|uniref:oligosaccharide repeat unit polymerase n=1 Tax=Acinetobacter sp. AS167 TaxID=3127884 RepID=UPI003017AF29